PYWEFEGVVLRYLNEVRPEDLESKKTGSDLAVKEQELAGVEIRLAQLREAMENPSVGNLPTLLASVAHLAKRKADVLCEIEALNDDLHTGRPLRDARNILSVLQEADPEQRDALRVRLRSLIAQVVKSIFIKPEKHYGRVYVLAQINFHNGLHKQINFGPGFFGGFGDQTCPSDFGMDLRDKTAARSRRVFAQLAEMLAQPSSAP